MGSMGFLSFTAAATSSLSLERVQWRQRWDFEIRESLGLREILSRVKRERERERERIRDRESLEMFQNLMTNEVKEKEKRIKVKEKEKE